MSTEYCDQCVHEVKARATARAMAWAAAHPERRREIMRKHTKTESFNRSQTKYRRGPSRNKYLVKLAKRRARRLGLAFDLVPADIIIPTVCPLLGIQLDDFSPTVDVHSSLDRITPSKGYVRGNVVVISWRANRIKNNSNAAELLLLATNLALLEK